MYVHVAQLIVSILFFSLHISLCLSNPLFNKYLVNGNFVPNTERSEWTRWSYSLHGVSILEWRHPTNRHTDQIISGCKVCCEKNKASQWTKIHWNSLLLYNYFVSSLLTVTVLNCKSALHKTAQEINGLSIFCFYT